MDSFKGMNLEFHYKISNQEFKATNCGWHILGQSSWKFWVNKYSSHQLWSLLNYKSILCYFIFSPFLCLSPFEVMCKLNSPMQPHSEQPRDKSAECVVHYDVLWFLEVFHTVIIKAGEAVNIYGSLDITIRFGTCCNLKDAIDFTQRIVLKVCKVSSI